MTTEYKIKDCFLLKNIAGENVVIMRGPGALEFSGTLILNESCALLWREMSTPCTKEQLSKMLVDEYHIDNNVAARDVDACIKKMSEYDLIDTMER